MGVIFIEDLPLEERQKLAEKRNKIVQEQSSIEDKECIYEYKYRFEQLIMFKVNSIPMDTYQTKTDYKVTKLKNRYIQSVSVEIDDESFTMFPDKLTNLMELVNGLEKIKCNAIFEVNNNDGKIKDILNYQKVIGNWESYKYSLSDTYKYARSPEAKESLDAMIRESEKVILNKPALMQELNAKTFFYLFFDKYLISRENLYNSYKQIFRSQLFQGLAFNLDVAQKILEESSDKVLVEKLSSMPNDLDRDKIKVFYDKEYLNKIGFKFYEY